MHHPINKKRQQRRCQQYQSDHRAALKILLPDHQLENVGGQHVEVSADHFRDAEIGDDQRKRDHCGTDQTIFGTGQGNGKKLARR